MQAYDEVTEDETRYLNHAVIAMKRNPLLKLHGISGLAGAATLVPIMQDMAAQDLLRDVLKDSLPQTHSYVEKLKPKNGPRFQYRSQS